MNTLSSMRYKYGLLLFAIIAPVIAKEQTGISETTKQSDICYSADLEKKALDGNATAQRLLGFCYGLGKGVNKDDQEAVKWITKAAENGDSEAQLSLGQCYERGVGLNKNMEQARKWITQAAEQGLGEAEVYLGLKFGETGSFGKDDLLAIKWLTKAAEKGNALGQNALAWILSTSSDPKLRNGDEAIKWARQALQSSGDSYAPWVDTLAAAYAEKGDYAMATSLQEKAIANLKDPKFEKDLKDHLASYQNKKAWREQQNADPQSSTNPQQNP